jgi:hypothetical protein
MKSPWVSGQVISVAMDGGLHYLSIFPGMFGLGIASYPSDNVEGPHLVAK